MIQLSGFYQAFKAGPQVIGESWLVYRPGGLHLRQDFAPSEIFLA